MTQPAQESMNTTGVAVSPASAQPDHARLECVGVTVRFGGLVAVRDVSLSLPAGKIVGLVGPNGAGKSTLFGGLSGLVRPTAGTVRLDDVDVTHMSPQRRALRGLSRTFQHPELFAGLTVRDHLVLAHRAKKERHRTWSDLLTMGSLRPESQSERTAVDELVGLLGLEALVERQAHGLPLGVARLVELGRALAAVPSVLLLDEPSSGLDAGETQQFESVLRLVSVQRGISVLLVEHDVELVMRMCGRVYVLDFGQMIASGTPAEVRADPAVRAAYLGEEVSATGERPAAGPPRSSGPADDDAAVAEHGGPAQVDERTEAAEPSRPAVGPSGSLVVDGLCVRYGAAVALNSVSFSVGAGEVVAVLGANGAGKSSLARAVSGLVAPAAGRIALDGADITGWSAHRVREAGVVHLPEGRGVFRSLNVMENLRLATASTEGRAARRAAVEAALEIFPALAERRRVPAGALSGGEQQMLSLARALATSPLLVLADEMSLGLAPKMVDIVFEGLGRMREAGVTVLMIEQYVHRALGFADSCLLLQRGSLVYQGAARDAGSEVLSRYLGEVLSTTS